MKRSLSLFLSLVLLVSVLVVPMTAFAEWKGFNTDDLNAAGAQNGYTCTLEKFTNNNDASIRYTRANNLLDGLTPKLYLKGKTVDRTEVEYSYNTTTGFPGLTNGILTANSDIRIYNQTFVTDGTKDDGGNLTAFANGYVPTGVFNFGNEITTYADIVYDLDKYYSISQIQHFTSVGSSNLTGIYQIYAAKTEAELFEQKSLLINYQITSDDITDQLTSQDFKFTDEDNQPTARYFAFRVLCPVAGIVPLNSTLPNDIRIRELAVCGTPNDKIFDVKVNKELYNNIAIKYADGSQCELVKAEEGKNVKFTLDLETIPDDVTVTVKYGDGIVTPDKNGVYTITVAKGKELHIIPSHLTTEYSKTEITPKFNEAQANNVALDIVPKLYKYNGSTRTEQPLSDDSDIVKLSNGNLSDSNADVSFGITFKKKVNNVFTDYVNNYTPGEPFNFNQESYDAYVDLVYDLGRPTDINKFQHIAASDSALGMGVYQLYASDSATNLFSKDSLICNYQKIDIAQKKYSQEIEFPTRTAQYVAIRCYMSITSSDATSGDYFYNCFRIGDIAIYGTKTNAVDYKVTEIQAPTGGSDAPTDVPNKESDLLNADTFESIKSYEGGRLVKTDETFYNRDTNLGKLNSQTYYNAGHGDFNLDVVFYANNTCKNGYSIDRTNTNGNITFTVPTEAPTVYYDFTYDLGDYYKIDRFGAYLNSAMDRRIQAYEVYIGNDLASLYIGEPVAVYNNYYNTYGQMITFDKAKVGKYIGFRVLNPGTANDDGNTYVRIDELAAYGTKVGAPADENLKAAITSNGVYILDNNNSSVYTGTDKTQRTALRLTVGYKSPKVPGGADASKIILPNGAEANVIERNVIAIAKSKYTGTLDIHTQGASVTTSTATSNEHPVSNYFKSEAIPDDSNYCMAYGALNINNISETNKDSQIVVIGRVVYEYQGEIYAVYSNIVGNETGKEITAQAAYNKLNDPSQGWFN